MSKRPHIPALDGIRGVAILMVFILHYGGGAQSRFWPIHLIGAFIKVGWTGVPLFFVLSGFLITGILWDSFDKPQWWKTFYIRRSLRIFPLYYLSILIVILSAIFFGDVHEALHNVWIYALYSQNFPFAAQRIQHLGSSVGLIAFWSLAVEEQFYLCWPFLLRCTRTLRQAKALCIALFVLAFLYRVYGSQPGHDAEILGDATLSRAGELAVGAWLALKLRGNPVEWSRFLRWVPIASILSLSGFIAVSVYSGEPETTHRAVLVFGLPFIAIFYGCLICMAITENSWVQRAASVAFLRWMGAISYSLYVWHELLNVPVTKLSLALAPHAGRDAGLALRFTVAAVVCVTVAQLSYRYFEMPFLRLKDRFPGSQPVVPITESAAAIR